MRAGILKEHRRVDALQRPLGGTVKFSGSVARLGLAPQPGIHSRSDARLADARRRDRMSCHWLGGWRVLPGSPWPHPSRVQGADRDDPQVGRREPNGRHFPVISGPKKPGMSAGRGVAHHPPPSAVRVTVLHHSNRLQTNQPFIVSPSSTFRPARELTRQALWPTRLRIRQGSKAPSRSSCGVLSAPAQRPPHCQALLRSVP